MNADLNNANKTNRRRTVKTRSRFTTLLTVYFFVALIIPNCVLANTEPYSVWTVEALILMPLGFYMMWSVALRRSGVMIWLAFPFIFFCAFQIVLLYLFGNGCSHQIHGGVVCLWLCAKLCLAVQSAVPEVYEQIRRYHSQVQQIDHQHIGVMDIDTQDKLGADAGDIAHHQQENERQAHALCAAALVVLHQIDRPGTAETDQHCRFQNSTHCLCPPMWLDVMLCV